MNPNIIDLINDAIGCAGCGASLSASMSDDFCSEECQRAWQAANVARAEQLDGPIDFGSLGIFAEQVRALSEALRTVGQAMSEIRSPFVPELTRSNLDA